MQYQKRIVFLVLLMTVQLSFAQLSRPSISISEISPVKLNLELRGNNELPIFTEWLVKSGNDTVYFSGKSNLVWKELGFNNNFGLRADSIYKLKLPILAHYPGQKLEIRVRYNNGKVWSIWNEFVEIKLPESNIDQRLSAQEIFEFDVFDNIDISELAIPQGFSVDNSLRNAIKIQLAERIKRKVNWNKVDLTNEYNWDYINALSQTDNKSQIPPLLFMSHEFYKKNQDRVDYLGTLGVKTVLISGFKNWKKANLAFNKVNDEQFGSNIWNLDSSNVQKQLFQAMSPTRKVMFEVLSERMSGAITELIINAVDNVHVTQFAIYPEINEDDIKVYPNPTTGELNISVPAADKDWKLSIFSQIGVIMLQRLLSPATTESLDVSNFDEGPYYIWLSNGERAFERKFIKIR